MKKIILILSLGILNCKVTVGGHNSQSSTPLNKTYHVICHRGVEYITRQWSESSFTLAVDKNMKPIQCKE